jgi:hypothetical protein
VKTQISKELILEVEVRYYDWIKGFQKAASAQRLMGLLGHSGAASVHHPKL